MTKSSPIPASEVNEIVGYADYDLTVDHRERDQSRADLTGAVGALVSPDHKAEVCEV
jgi:hypothetical protein